MGLIEYYLLFAFSTSITACYLWYWPLVIKAQSKDIKNSFTENVVLSLVIYLIVSTVIAPMLVAPLLFSSLAQKFEEGLAKEILKND